MTVKAIFYDQLTRVVARDGTVWWVSPEIADEVRARESRYVSENGDDGGYNKFYWRVAK